MTNAAVSTKKDIPEIEIIEACPPIVGTRLKKSCLVNDLLQKIFFDTGSPTSLISKDVVPKHCWPTYPVPAFTWEGAMKGKTSTTTTTVRGKLEISD